MKKIFLQYIRGYLSSYKKHRIWKIDCTGKEIHPSNNIQTLNTQNKERILKAAREITK